MDTLNDFMFKTKLLSGFSLQEAQAILPLLDVQTKRYEKGEIIVGMDDIINDISLVCSGAISIFKQDVYGKPNLIRKITAPGLFGIEVACTPTKISPFIITSDTQTEVISFSYQLIESPGSLPDKLRCVILKNLLEIISNANMRQLYKIDILSKKSLRDRILLYLKLQARRKQSNELKIPFNREEFAAYLCVDRSALSRELSRMQNEGLIKFKNNRFELLIDCFRDNG